MKLIYILTTISLFFNLNFLKAQTVTIDDPTPGQLATYTFTYVTSHNIGVGTSTPNIFYLWKPTGYPNFLAVTPLISFAPYATVKDDGVEIPINSINFGTIYGSWTGGIQISTGGASGGSTILAGSTIEIIVSGIITNPASGSHTFNWRTSSGSGTPTEDFSVTVDFSALPVDLINFEASAINDRAIQLEWQTASESNNDYFTIEKSKNGIEWEELKRIDGAGNSSTLLSYSAVDQNPYFGTSYYRLKQTDLDGKFEYFNVRSVEFDKPLSSEVEIYPNPTNHNINLIGDAYELQQVRIFNNIGQDVTSSTIIKANNEEDNILIDLSNLATGIYFIKTRTSANKIYKQ